MNLLIQKIFRQVAFLLVVSLLGISTASAISIEDKVMRGCVPIVGADVILSVAGSGVPVRLVGTQSGAGRSFTVTIVSNQDDVGVPYLITRSGEATAEAGKGPNPEIMLMTIPGTVPPPHVTINELTTIASVWTAARYMEDTSSVAHAATRKMRSSAWTVNVVFCGIPLIIPARLHARFGVRETNPAINGMSEKYCKRRFT